MATHHRPMQTKRIASLITLHPPEKSGTYSEFRVTTRIWPGISPTDCKIARVWCSKTIDFGTK